MSNPDTIITVALSRAEALELLEASSFVSWENPDYLSARDKLKRAVRPPHSGNAGRVEKWGTGNGH